MQYLKWAVNKYLIFNKLEELKKKKINFFIDVQSICRGFYNKSVVISELGHYSTEGSPSNVLIVEMREFLNSLYKTYKQYDPFFVLFYDDGFNLQNKSIFSSYKSGISTLSLMLEDEQTELFKQIKQYYFKIMPSHFEKKDISKVFYLKEYESDCIPFYCITTNLFDSFEQDVLNVIFSTDKDLLQTTKFDNTVQYISWFSPTKVGKQINQQIFTSYDSISYIYKDFKPGILNSKHIPLILALAGDQSDKIPGIKGIGPKKAIDLIQNNKIPTKSWQIERELDRMPEIIKNNFSFIERNLKLIDFELQIERMPKSAFYN